MKTYTTSFLFLLSLSYSIAASEKHELSTQKKSIKASTKSIILNVKRFEFKKPYAIGPRQLPFIAISADGALIGECIDDTIRISDRISQRVIREISADKDNAISSFTMSPDGQKVAVCLNNRTLQVVDVSSGKIVHSSDFIKHSIGAIAMSSSNIVVGQYAYHDCSPTPYDEGIEIKDIGSLNEQ